LLFYEACVFNHWLFFICKSSWCATKIVLQVTYFYPIDSVFDIYLEHRLILIHKSSAYADIELMVLLVAITLANLMFFFLGHIGQLRIIILRKNRVEKPLQNTHLTPYHSQTTISLMIHHKTLPRPGEKCLKSPHETRHLDKQCP
jgi:hypothetical protein